MAARFRAQLLSGMPAGSAGEVVHRLLAVQGQDPRGARLSIRSRSAGVSAADVDRALTDDRSMLITWLNRGTLHLVGAEEYWWLHPLTTPRLVTAARRRLEQEGMSEPATERGIDLIVSALAGGPLTRRQLGSALAGAGLPGGGQALLFTLFLASCRGLTVRGPMIGGEQAYVLVRDWLGLPRQRWSATSRWPNSLADTCSGMPRPTTGTWRSGLDFRSGTPAGGSPRSRPS